jgi:DNA-directed RNA polymerase specialized sigma24 family protein
MNNEVFEVLYLKQKKHFFSLILKKVKDISDAEDLESEFWLIVSKLEEEKAVAPFLVGILDNLISDYFRKLKKAKKIVCIPDDFYEEEELILFNKKDFTVKEFEFWDLFVELKGIKNETDSMIQKVICKKMGIKTRQYQTYLASIRKKLGK